jgi:hypothetical protein
MPRQRTTATESEVAPTEKAARESAEEDLERSHVSGLKFDLAAAAELDGMRAAFDAARASEENTAPQSPEQLTFEAREASMEPAPAPRARLPEDDDELRDAERVRQEARETRRESERVRADARAAGQHEADWERPEAGWHEVRLAPAVEATDAPTEGESHGAASSQPLAAGLSAPEQATLGSGDSGVHLAAEVAARSEGDVSIEAGEANRKAAAPPAQETHDGEQALSEVGVREVARDESLETDAAREVARDVIGAPLVPHLRLVEPLPVSPDDGAGERAKRGDGEEAELRAAALSEPAFAEPALAAPEDESHPREQGTAAETPQIEPAEHITYGPHPQDGMLLRWRVTPEAIERARKLLGSSGELAVRIVAVRVEPHAVVKTDVIDHGPIEESGDWTAPLLPTEARYVSAVGLKSANKFVSIVHAKS